MCLFLKTKKGPKSAPAPSSCARCVATGCPANAGNGPGLQHLGRCLRGEEKQALGLGELRCCLINEGQEEIFLGRKCPGGWLWGSLHLPPQHSERVAVRNAAGMWSGACNPVSPSVGLLF